MNTHLPSALTFTRSLRAEPDWCRSVIRASAMHSSGLLRMMSLCADDIVSDVIVCMQKNSRVFRSRDDLGRYLARATTNRIRSLARKHELRTRRGLHDFDPPELDSLPASGPTTDFCLWDEYAALTAWMRQDEDGSRLLAALNEIFSVEERPTTSAIGRAMGRSRRDVDKLLQNLRTRACNRFRPGHHRSAGFVPTRMSHT